MAQEWSKKISDNVEKTAFLYIIAKAQSNNEMEYVVEDEILPTPSKEKGIFLNKKDQWFKLYGCHCNRPFETEDIINIIYSP